MNDDKRLIEDFLPLQHISTESGREKSTRKGHISSIHLWWARRPLVASRAAVFAALVSAPSPQDSSENQAGRRSAADFIKSLCVYPGTQSVSSEAETRVLEAHASRLTRASGVPVTASDIRNGKAPRPKLLDMFAGGGAIPLEALRLGCDAHAIDLNPVAHIVELCTLVYPQKYGRPDKNALGSRDGTWGGLANEVEHWGARILEYVKKEVASYYPLIPDPNRKRNGGKQDEILWKESVGSGRREGYLTPMAYLWTRTVVCKNPKCGGVVPLAKQTWLCKKPGRFAALRPSVRKDDSKVHFVVVETDSEAKLGFDPDKGSKRGNATCLFCGTVADSDFVKSEGCEGRIGQQLMAIVCTKPGERGKVYVSADDAKDAAPSEELLRQRIAHICSHENLTLPTEPIPTNTQYSPGPLYGLKTWADLFTSRQLLCLMTFLVAVRQTEQEMKKMGYDQDHIKAVLTYFGAVVDRVAVFGNSLCAWYYQEQAISWTFSRQALPMLWDFGEISIHADISGGIAGGLARIKDGIDMLQDFSRPAFVYRAPAQHASDLVSSCDVVVTDPPYYDNIPYSDLSDFFYVWLRRSVGHLYPEHFASELTPKKEEAIASVTRHGGSKEKAKEAYEAMMAQAFVQANRALKAEGLFVVVYAHKTTLGWATLVDALRKAGFMITEAWPLDTEGPGRIRAHNSAALASSIFLVSRKREGVTTGTYEINVRSELEDIVRERVTTLWNLGVSGADLVIACVGAGLRAFTRYSRVEYTNGEEVPAERFLTEVEAVVLESILARLSREVGGSGGQYDLANIDPWTRFYILWRYTYKSAELDAGEAIIFANGTHVELDGPHGLSNGPLPLIEKKKAAYRLLDYSERGDDLKLGLSSEDGNGAPLIDALHRLLWLMERHQSAIAEFLREARPNTEQLRLVAQALAGPALKGGELAEVASGTELAALTKLTANWRSVVEDAAEATVGPLFRTTAKNK